MKRKMRRKVGKFFSLMRRRNKYYNVVVREDEREWEYEDAS